MKDFVFTHIDESSITVTIQASTLENATYTLYACIMNAASYVIVP